MPLASDDVSATLGELHLIILGTSGFDAYCGEVVDASVAALAPLQVFCSLILQREGRLQTVASSHVEARVADENQFRQHRGPCLDALRLGRQIVVDDLASNPYWATLRHAGFAASVSSPVLVSGQAVGALSVYSAMAFDFTAAQRSSLRTNANRVSIALTVTRRLAEQADLGAQLVASLAARVLVDQAVGVIMGQSRCTAQDAFQILRRAGIDQHRSLDTVARAVVLAATADLPYAAPDPR